MEKFSAHLYFWLGNHIAKLKASLEKVGPLSMQLDGAADVDALTTIKAMRTLCSRIGLPVSVKCLDKLQAETARGGILSDFVGRLTQLEDTIRWEMEERLFMYIPSERAGLYDQPELFGGNVIAKWPEIQFDIVEAGNCYVTGRSTAAVFHLMRIMETSLQKLGTHIGVALANEKNWQNILDEVNKKIKTLPAKDSNTIALAQVSANLYAVKLAWRNEVMHPKDTYTLEEADNLIRQVRLFVENLAKLA